MRAKTSFVMLLMLFGAVSCAAGRPEHMGSQAAMDHGTHRMPAETQPQQKPSPAAEAEHAVHEIRPAVTEGSWSYLSRDNPEPFKDRRWEMVPSPGYGHMYLNTGSLSRELICGALSDNPSIMVDRATRSSCGMPVIPASVTSGRAGDAREPVKKEATEHERHAGMEMQREDMAKMHEHWTAPEDAAKRPNPVPAESASIDRGRALFQTHCAVCHGPKGLGDGPASSALTPRPDNLAIMAGQHPVGDLAWKIENGRGSMPAWKSILTEPQIWDLVNFLKDLKKSESKSEPPAHRHDVPGHAH